MGLLVGDHRFFCLLCLALENLPVAPDQRWVIGFFGAMFLLGLGILVLSIKRILFGPDRFGAWTGLLVGLAPLFVWPYLFSEVYWRATVRQNLPNQWIVGPLAAVASNVADAEVHYRYPRRVKGERVTLIDRGEPEDAETLLASMDRHIESMCKELKAELELPVYWVRGKLLETNGQSFAGWAICEDQPVGTQLTYVDRHEVAHATIGLLSEPTSLPPSLLVEGWAEYQSRDRADSRRRLLDAIAQGSVPKLDEMIHPRWYGRSVEHTYIVGAPYVEFLIQKHGGAKFLQLYRNTSQASFPNDFLRVFETDWASEPSEFYTWLKEKHPEVPIEGKRSEDYVETTRQRLSSIRLGGTVDKEEWNDLIQSAAPFFEARSQLAPSSLDLRTTKAIVDSETESTNEVKRLSESTRLVFGDQQAWLSKSARAKSEAKAVAPGFAFEAIRQSGSLDRRGKVVESEADRKQLRETIAKELRDIQLTGDLIAALDQLNPNDGSMEVVSLTNLGDFIVLEVATSKTQKASFRIDRRKDLLIVESDILYRDGGSSSLKYGYELGDSIWTPRDIEGTLLEGDGTGIVMDTVFLKMDPFQERSFIDELRAITLKEDEVAIPLWLSMVRWIGIGWTSLACLMMALFGLLRL